MSLCLVRVVTTYNKPVVNLTVGLDNLSNLLSIFELNEDVKSYSVENGFGFTVDKNDIQLINLYTQSFAGIHPPSFNKWIYLH
jgi:hypothetical protein